MRYCQDETRGGVCAQDMLDSKVRKGTSTYGGAAGGSGSGSGGAFRRPSPDELGRTLRDIWSLN
jgi:hypothetical protein